MDLKSPQSRTIPQLAGLGLILLLLFAVLSLLFHNQFLPGHTLFSNDGPLGALPLEAYPLSLGEGPQAHHHVVEAARAAVDVEAQQVRSNARPQVWKNRTRIR